MQNISALLSVVVGMVGSCIMFAVRAARFYSDESKEESCRMSGE